jgi:HD-GYP domain-containing protein (c-di-GMP phosphodiesterase class II)
VTARRLDIDAHLLRSLLTLATVIEARDPFTGGHIWRTSRYAVLLADKLGLEVCDVFLCQLGALVHDIGKIGIPDRVLIRRGPLGKRDRAIMERHPEIGGQLIADHPLAPLVHDPVTEHHLHPDGSGYPNDGAPRVPSLISRIVAVADTFDAMTAVRPYRRPCLVPRALAEMRKVRGTQLDGQAVDAFLALARTGALEHVVAHHAEDRLLQSCETCGPIITLPSTARDGEEVVCPACGGQYVLHLARDLFELEFRGRRAGVTAAEPDLEPLEEVIAHAPSRVVLPDR